MVSKYSTNNSCSLADEYDLGKDCQKALQQRSNFSFAKLISLVKKAKFQYKRTNGSHHVYEHPTHILDGPPLNNILTFQERKGKAKAYQIKKLVEFINYATRKERE